MKMETLYGLDFKTILEVVEFLMFLLEMVEIGKVW